jgi:hypothetical protein
LGAKKGIETAPCQKINGTDWKKGLANRWNSKRITKKAHAGRGLETKWEMSDDDVSDDRPEPDLPGA